MPSEASFKSKLIKKLEKLLPGCHIIKNDAAQTQGIPDILVLFKNRWFALELKRSNKAHKQVNQQFYIDKFDAMSFASFISPENEEKVLNDIQQTFST